jgi:hypothetical protein
MRKRRHRSDRGLESEIDSVRIPCRNAVTGLVMPGSFQNFHDPGCTKN